MDGLRDIAGGGYGTVGRIGVRGADVATGTVDFANVFGEVKPVSEPRGILLNSQRASGYGLRGIPGNEPEAGCALRVRSQQAI